MHFATNPTLWTGRATEESQAYWYQQVECLAVDSSLPFRENLPPAFVLIGYAVDEGVRRNLGRTGAAEGPDAIRTRLAREPWHLPDNTAIYDWGNVTCEDEALDEAQQTLSYLVAKAQQRGYITLVLGGGHDVASAHFIGLYEAFEDEHIGAINCDAHLDLRPIENGKLTSGTPFSVIADLAHQQQKSLAYLCLGAQQQGNTASLFERANSLGARVVMLNETDKAAAEIAFFCSPLDKVYLTIDLDGFPGYVSPGVSAPGVDGFSYRDVERWIKEVVATKKMVALDFAECNPSLDIDGRTARLAARLLVVAVTAMVAH